MKLLHESRCNRTAMLNPRCKGPRDYLEALTRRVSRRVSYPDCLLPSSAGLLECSKATSNFVAIRRKREASLRANR